MTSDLTLRPWRPAEQAQLETIVHLWNETLPSDLHISNKLIQYNCDSPADLLHAGQWALLGDEAVGLIIVSTLQAPSASPETADGATAVGWIDALIVQPTAQGRQIGSTLVHWGEAWLASHGCQTIEVGGSPRPFAPGVPAALGTAAFFLRHGYGNPRQVWDLSANLAGYQPPLIVQPIDGLVRPAQASDVDELEHFLQREFPGRWHQGFRTFVGGTNHRISDYMVLWTERGIDGFCRLTFEDSTLPIERFYPYQLARPWGQVGPIGVSADQRGRGFGAALLDASLRRLHNNGVNGCIIDWTTLLAFYAHFGFAPYREYLRLSKEIREVYSAL